MDNLGELFRQAREFGRVSVYTHDDGTYSCTIKFNSIEHTELKAESGFKHKEPELAISAALKVAQNIVNSMQTTVEKFKNLLRLK